MNKINSKLNIRLKNSEFADNINSSRNCLKMRHGEKIRKNKQNIKKAVGQLQVA